MARSMKKNMALGIILDVLCSGGAVILVEFVISLIEKRPFSLDWRWVIWFAVIATIVDVVTAWRKKEKQ